MTRDWNELERWDRAYYMHGLQAESELDITAVDATEDNYLVLADGTRLLDFMSQLISDNMGHRHPAIHGALAEAMERYGHVTYTMANEYRARAAKLVIADILGGEGWAGRLRVLPSGTEATESCITMARLYTGRSVILTQAHSFHGMTVGATMMRGYRNNISTDEGFAGVADVPGWPPHGYIPIPPPEHEDWQGTGPLPSLEATEHIVRAIGPENIAAVISEPMFGAGGTFPHTDYMPGLRALCDRYGFLWIDDEVICGFGRLGEWFGYMHWPGVKPDLMAAGKGINGSALPVGAVIASETIADYFEKARWWTGSTWDGHPLVCATIVGNLEYMLAHDIMQQVRQRGAYLKDPTGRAEGEAPLHRPRFRSRPLLHGRPGGRERRGHRGGGPLLGLHRRSRLAPQRHRRGREREARRLPRRLLAQHDQARAALHHHAGGDRHGCGCARRRAHGNRRALRPLRARPAYGMASMVGSDGIRSSQCCFERLKMWTFGTSWSRCVMVPTRTP